MYCPISWSYFMMYCPISWSYFILSSLVYPVENFEFSFTFQFHFCLLVDCYGIVCFRVAKSIERKNLKEVSHESSTLGSGAFGVCKKMLYRGITVAVKTFQEDAHLNLVKWEADVLFDHPGTAL